MSDKFGLLIDDGWCDSAGNNKAVVIDPAAEDLCRPMQWVLQNSLIVLSARSTRRTGLR